MLKLMEPNLMLGVEAAFGMCVHKKVLNCDVGEISGVVRWNGLTRKGYWNGRNDHKWVFEVESLEPWQVSTTTNVIKVRWLGYKTLGVIVCNQTSKNECHPLVIILRGLLCISRKRECERV